MKVYEERDLFIKKHAHAKHAPCADDDTRTCTCSELSSRALQPRSEVRFG